MKASKKQILRHVFLISFFLCALLSWNVMTGYGQETAPKRGFQPGASYALSDIESINTTNGNMMMHFPLASLPPGRGLTASINLLYSSKLYNSHTGWARDYGRPCQSDGGEPAQLTCPYFQRDDLQQTADGNWRYALAYTVEVIDRTMEGSLDPNMQCSVSGAPSDGYLPMTYRFKVKIHFPDGSVHEMRPSGYTDLNSQDALGDYYNIRPDGWIEDCFQGGHWSNASAISYYSTDGTYLRLEFQTVSHNGWWNDPWTLYLPDGSHVTGGNAPERMYDRNSNYVEVDNIANYQRTGLAAVQLIDQLNRSITLVYGGAGADGDTITSQGVGDTLVWKVRWKTIGADKQYWPCPESLQGCQIRSSGDPRGPGPETFLQNVGVVDRITLPSQAGNLFYSFSYNAPDRTTGGFQPSYGWGELSGVTLPSTAQASYQYFQDGQNNLSTPDVMGNYPTRKDLAYDREYDGAATPITETWTYATLDNGGSTGPTSGTVTAPDGGVNTDIFAGTNSQTWDAGLVYSTVHPDGSKTERIWAANNPGSSMPVGANPYVKTEFTSIKNAAGSYVKSAVKDYKYDKNGNVIRVAEYDWLDYASVPRNSYGFPTGVPSGALPARITTNTYCAATPEASQSASNGNIYWFQSSPLLKNAVASTEVSNGTGPALSRAELTYDNPLTTGNVTQKTSWDSTKGGYSNPLTTGNSVSVSSQYDNWSNGNTGKLIQTTDARGTITVLTYDPVGGFDLYPTQSVTASGTSIARTETRSYDFSTGLVTSATDADNNVSTSTTYDVFGRPTLVKAAVGKPEETRTRTEYDDTLRRVIVHSDLNTLGDEKLVAIQHYDQLGRVRLVRQLEDSTTQSATDETTGIKVQTRYLFSGANSYSLSSNPYRAAYSSSAGSEGTMGWTRSKSDNTGRMIELQTFGGSGLPAPWSNNTTSTGTVTTAYDANFTTVTDQALRMRRSMTNGLGQLVRVDEPGDPNTNNSVGTTDNPAQPTSYFYDALGNLRQVVQSQQQRFFMYDSLSRLMRARNPEQLINSSLGITDPVTNNSQWCMSYDYDDNGNLSHKTDARGVVSTYLYDRLNRNYSVAYINDPANTAAVTRTYDNPTSGAHGKGRLWSTQTSANTLVTIDSYDALGRPKSQGQQFYYNNTWTQPYSITSITYDRAGHLLSETYPSGRVVTNTFDNAGRLNTFMGNLGDGTTRTYSTGITYASAGQMGQEQFGTTTTPIYNKLSYNSRQQLSEILASTTGGDASFNRGKIVNDYSDQCSGTSCNGTDNNGNLKRQTVFIPNNEQNASWTSWNQQYGYDSLNRLTSVGEYTSGTQPTWQQSYQYDRWGNRTIDGNTSKTWGYGINSAQAVVSTATNRMYGPNETDASHTLTDYDLAGNQTKDYLTSNGTRSYDAENRMVSAIDSSYGTSTYTYDGDGHRVKRKVNNTETWQVYGLGGELIAEYAQNASYATPQKEYGYRNGQLLITADAASGGGGSGPQSVTWTNAVGVSVSGNSLTKTAANGWGNAGASSTQSIASGDGYVECTASETTTYRMIGLSHGDTNQDYDDIDFAIYQYGGGALYVFEGGVYRGQVGTYATGDVLRVAVEGGVVKYKKNGTLLYTSTVAPTYPLLVDTSLYHNGSTLSNAVISIGASGGGSTQNVSFTNAVGVAVSGNSLTKTAADGWANAGASSTQSIASGDGYVECTASETTTYRMIGLSHGDTNQDYDDIDFAIYQYGGGALYVFEGGIYRGQVGTYATGDILRVAVEGGVVKYKKNGTLLYTSTVPPTYPLLVDTSLYHNGSTLNNVVISSAGGGSGGSSAQIHWLVTDQLGTPRMIFDQTGSLASVSRHDYLPFGEEVPANFRTGIPGYSASDNVRQKFTQKERDNETGLDYSINRYYSSTQGRFTSPDPTLLSVLAFNPQTWNRYAYVMNNPLLYVDPLGLWALEYDTIYKTDKKTGQYVLDKKGDRVIDHVVVTAVATQDGDNGASLAKQLGLTGKAAERFAAKIGDTGNEVHLSDQGGDVGRVFGKVEEGLSRQAKWEASNPGQFGGPGPQDCSYTALSMAFPQEMSGSLTASVQQADAAISAKDATSSVQESNLRLGDIARWADAKNKPQHFASFIFRDDTDHPIVFSKSGTRGPFETATTSDGRWTRYGYGTITGINKGDTGFYRPR